jgi:hypothetical protein
MTKNDTQAGIVAGMTAAIGMGCGANHTQIPSTAIVTRMIRAKRRNELESFISRPPCYKKMTMRAIGCFCGLPLLLFLPTAGARSL